jgi:hypothetical protein
MTVDQVKALTHGQTVYHIINKNADGTAMRVRVTGKVKTWKRDAGRVQVSVKRGMYEYGYITEYNCGEFTLNEPAKVKKAIRANYRGEIV